MANSTRTPIVIIGGGIGGLSAAISLASQGYPVQLFEQQPYVGGKMAEVRAHGFRWDTGPTVITMRHVFADLFAQAGRRLEDYLTLISLDPSTRYFFRDGTVFDLCRDWPELAAQIEALDPRDVSGYLQFLAFAAELHRITGPAFIYSQPPRPADFLRIPPSDILKVGAWSTLARTINRYVNHPHMQQLFARFATYVGADPYSAPATLAVIAHVELTGGVWYPQGGVYAIARALERLAHELGVEIFTDTPISQILTRNGCVDSVQTTDGQQIPARHIIANVDVATVHHKLLHPAAVPNRYARRLAQLEPSCSGFVLLLGVKGQHAQLAHHNIFFAPDYRREFSDIFRRQTPPQDPTVYVAISSKTDPDHAPEGHENWFVLVNAPALNDGYDWTDQAPAYRERVLDTLARFGLDVRRSIVHQLMFTPQDLAENTGAWRGALYGISSNNPLNAFRRPHNRSPHIQGLYFAGGAAHPGGGVPMVALSGRLAADVLMADTRNA